MDPKSDKKSTTPGAQPGSKSNGPNDGGKSLLGIDSSAVFAGAGLLLAGLVVSHEIFDREYDGRKFTGPFFLVNSNVSGLKHSRTSWV